jgi:WD40 repeat protein
MANPRYNIVSSFQLKSVAKLLRWAIASQNEAKEDFGMRILSNSFLYIICPLLVAFIVLEVALRPTKFIGGRAFIFEVAATLDGKTLASCSVDNDVSLWDVASGRRRTIPNEPTTFANNIAFSPDGTILASFSNVGDETLRLWDVATCQERVTFQGCTNRVWCVAFSADSKTIASGSWDGMIRFWNTSTGEEMATIDAYSNYVCSLAFSPDGKTLASADKATMRLWDVGTGKLRSTRDGLSWSVVAFSPDGNLLAYASEAALRVVDVADGTERLFEASESKGASQKAHARSLKFSPDGETVALISEIETDTTDEPVSSFKICFWDVASGKRTDTIGRGIRLIYSPLSSLLQGLDASTDEPRVSGLLFHPNGKVVALVSEDGTAEILEIHQLWESLSVFFGSSLLALVGIRAYLRYVRARRPAVSCNRPVEGD